MQLAGSGMAVYSGSELSAGIAPATLKLARGGKVRICPNSGLNVTASGQGLMLATGTGALEIEYELKQQAADVVITPDFNVALVGPGTFHFALGINKKGDTCVKPLAGNAGEITFSELLGTGIYKSGRNQAMVFRGGKLDGKTELKADCTFSAGTWQAFKYNFNREQYGKPPVIERQAPGLVVGTKLGAESVLERSDDSAAIRVVLWVGSSEQEEIQGKS